MTTPDHPPVSLVFEPVDTWYFADATPPDAATTGDLGGIFPPFPPTVVGAVRAELARAHGWSGNDRWSDELTPLLGDGYGPEDLGPLHFDGPYLVRCGRRLYPVPAHLCGVDEQGSDGGDDADRRWRPTTLMRPGDAPVTCDLGEAVRLPELGDAPEGTAPKPHEGAWLHADAFAQVLHGEAPCGSAVVTEDELWHRERRIGLSRDNITRTAEHGQLYTAQHVRLRPGVGIGVTVYGLPPAAADRLTDGALIPFGGEARMARLWRRETQDRQPPVAAAAGNAGSTELTAVALTPLDVDDDVYRGSATLPTLGGARIVSACLPRPRRVGGWSSVQCSQQHPQAAPTGPGPRTMRSTLPPGSVLFCEADQAALEQDVAASTSSTVHIGCRPRWGFGAVALGRWPQKQADTGTSTREGEQ